jgi:hypothetical protein
MKTLPDAREEEIGETTLNSADYWSPHGAGKPKAQIFTRRAAKKLANSA